MFFGSERKLTQEIQGGGGILPSEPKMANFKHRLDFIDHPHRKP